MKYIFGDSHVRRIKRLKDGKPADVAIVNNHGQNFVDLDLRQTDSSLHVFSDKVEAFDPVDLTVTGDDQIVFSAPLHSSLVVRHRMWKTYVHWSLAQNHPRRTAVSDNVYDQLAIARNQSSFAFIRGAKEIGAQVAVLEPPRLSRRAIGASGLSEAVLALNDACYRAAVCRQLDTIGVEVIATPRATNDGSFLLPKFEAITETDVHHGNKHYAELALQTVLAFFERCAR